MRIKLGLLSAATLTALVAGLITLGEGVTNATTPAPTVLNSNAATDTGRDSHPQVATDGAGHWVAVWHSDDNLDGIGTDFDVIVSRSADYGVTWTDLAALNTNAATDSGNDYRAQVTTDGAGTWVAVWTSEDSLGGAIGTDFDIIISRSTDDGITWTAPMPLNSNAATDFGHDTSPQLTTDGAGIWLAVWMSSDSLGGTIGTDTDILVSRSTDNGVTWTDPAPLNTDAAYDPDGDQSPQVTTDRRGTWLATWNTDDRATARTFIVVVSRSTDNGDSWTTPTDISSTADPHADYMPQVATDGAGTWVATWWGGAFSDTDIFVSRSTDDGISWSAPDELNTNAATDIGFDAEPRVATDGSGTWVTVWSSDDSLGGTIGTDYDLLISRSTNNGIAWTDPTPLNSNASSDLGHDFSPQVTTDGAGDWLFVWVSTDSLNGTIGTDRDILFTECVLIGADGACIGADPLRDTDGDGVLDGFDSCPLDAASGYDADSDGCRDTLPGFVAFVSELEDVPVSVRETILRKAASAEHLLCHIGNVRGSFGKLRGIGNYIGSQSGKKISENTASVLSGYVGNLWGQIKAGQDVCSSP